MRFSWQNSTYAQLAKCWVHGSADILHFMIPLNKVEHIQHGIERPVPGEMASSAAIWHGIHPRVVHYQ